MNSRQQSWMHAIVRAAVVAGSAIVVGLVFYQSWIFTPTMRAFQFTLSGITAGLAYAALKGSDVRNGLAALFLWYIVLTLLIEEFNSWLLILNLAYVGGIATAVYVYDYAVEKRFVRGPFQRIIVAGGLIAIANGLIVVVLALVSLKVAIAHPASVVEAIYYNLQLGALIGLASGSGIEIADYLVRQLGGFDGDVEDESSIS